MTAGAQDPRAYCAWSVGAGGRPAWDLLVPGVGRGSFHHRSSHSGGRRVPAEMSTDPGPVPPAPLAAAMPVCCVRPTQHCGSPPRSLADPAARPIQAPANMEPGYMEGPPAGPAHPGARSPRSLRAPLSPLPRRSPGRASCTMTSRLVRASDSKIVCRSSGTIVRRSITSTSMPSPASVSATATLSWSMRE